MHVVKWYVHVGLFSLIGVIALMHYWASGCSLDAAYIFYKEKTISPPLPYLLLQYRERRPEGEQVSAGDSAVLLFLVGLGAVGEGRGVE